MSKEDTNQWNNLQSRNPKNRTSRRRQPTIPQQKDVGNAQRFADEQRSQIFWCEEENTWYAWDGHRWAKCGRLQIIQRVMRFAKDQLKAAIMSDSSDERRHAEHSMNQARIAAIESLARAELIRSVATLDTHRNLLNCLNGTVDLQTGQVSSHEPTLLLTQVCPTTYDSEAECPRFNRFLEEILPQKSEVVEFLQRFLGYCLTGEVSEQMMLFFIGSGANGKSTLLNVLQSVLGMDYCIQAEPTLLVAKASDAHPTEKMDLKGVRLAVCSETSMGRRLDEAKVKILTGGDGIRARRMCENSQEFSPTHKLILQSNYFPDIEGTDDGIWRRIVPVRFEQSFARGKQNLDLVPELVEERSGILRWLVEGCNRWYQNGLEIPAEIDSERERRRENADPIGRFLRDKCETSPKHKIVFRTLYDAYEAWCEIEGETPKTNRQFGASLASRGFESRHSGGKLMLGLKLADI